MKRALSCAVIGWMALSGCDEPCKPGYAKSGWDCKKLPEVDAGLGDGGTGQNANGGMDGGGAEVCLPPECDPCDAKPCQNGGACETTASGFDCTCPVGFRGARCQIDPCELDPCLHGGECKRTAGGRVCTCADDWTGDACEINTNPYLASIVPSAGSLYPAFTPSTLTYSVQAGIGVAELSFVLGAVQPEGVALKVGDETVAPGTVSNPFSLMLNTQRDISITSTADDGSAVTYLVRVRRTLTQQAYVKSPSASAGALLGNTDQGMGQSVSVEGGLLAVAESLASDERGVVRLFARSGNSWGYSNGLTHSEVGARFGASVRVTSKQLFVGAPGVDQVRVYARGDLGRGSPEFALLRPPAGAPTTGQFGYGIATTGNTLFVGAPGSTDTDVPTAIQPWSGEVHVFESEGQAWVWKQVLLAPPPAVPDDRPGLHFGAQVAAEGDVLAVGDPYSGRVYAYRKADDQWLSDGPLDLGSEAVTSIGGAALGVSGGRIAVAESYLSPFGSTNFIGEPRVTVFEHSPQGWQPTGTAILPQVPNVPGNLAPAGFGTSGLAFSGNTIVVGAPQDRGPGVGVQTASAPEAEVGSSAGAAYVFTKRTTGWALAAYVKASNAESEDGFGASVALSGSTLVVSAPYEDSASVSVNGDQASNASSNSGAIYVFSVACDGLMEGEVVQSCE